jgi:hypothetical protein
VHVFRVQRFSLKILNEVEGKHQYLFEISKRFTSVENLDDDVDINPSRTQDI